MPRHIPLFPGLLHVHHDKASWTKTFQRLCKRGGYDSESACLHPAQEGQTSAVILDGVVHVVSGVFDKDPETACHEAVHCAQEVAKHCAIDPLAEQEGFAYLTAHFFKELQR